MLRRLLPLALTAVLFCPMAAFAQTPTDQTLPVAPAVTPAPAAPAVPGDAPAPKKHNHVGGKISSVDAAAKTITLTHGKKTTVLSVPDGTKIYKVGDAKGQPTGTFADLTLDTRINAATNGDETSPVAKNIHIRAPKTAAPAVP
jgi:Cu/Ag efflux protein CusF